MIPPPPISTLFPYTTLFRSVYLKTVIEPKSEKAMVEMIQADEYFQQDSIVLALKGSPGSFQGYEQIIDKDRKSTRLNSSHVAISYAVFCLKKKKTHKN